MDAIQLVDSLTAKCLAENQLPADPKLIQQLIAIFRKARKRTFTPEMRVQLQKLGIQAKPKKVPHAEVVRAAIQANGLTTVERCANAFIAGLTVELIALRSPLRAYAVVAQFPDHQSTSKNKCRICGYTTQLLNSEYCAVDNLQGLLVSGIHGRVDDAYAAAQTLDWFALLPPIVPTAEQVAKFEEVLDIIARAPARATCNSLTKDLSGPLGGDKYQRLSVIETLGYCGVLPTAHGTPLLGGWVDRDVVQEHPDKFNEAESPACFWKREFGFNGQRFRELFPGVRLPAQLDSQMT